MGWTFVARDGVPPSRPSQNRGPRQLAEAFGRQGCTHHGADRARHDARPCARLLQTGSPSGWPQPRPTDTRRAQRWRRRLVGSSSTISATAAEQPRSELARRVPVLDFRLRRRSHGSSSCAASSRMGSTWSDPAASASVSDWKSRHRCLTVMITILLWERIRCRSQASAQTMVPQHGAAARSLIPSWLRRRCA